MGNAVRGKHRLIASRSQKRMFPASSSAQSLAAGCSPTATSRLIPGAWLSGIIGDGAAVIFRSGDHSIRSPAQPDKPRRAPCGTPISFGRAGRRVVGFRPSSTGTLVFSLMTSFTGRYQDILYTSLRRGLREKALVRGLDGMGNGGHRRAAGAFCGEREPWGKNDAGTVPGV